MDVTDSGSPHTVSGTRDANADLTSQNLCQQEGKMADLRARLVVLESTRYIQKPSSVLHWSHNCLLIVTPLSDIIVECFMIGLYFVSDR